MLSREYPADGPVQIRRKIPSLLVACMRADDTAASGGEVRHEASEFDDWASLAQQAETHGLGPLLYKSLQSSGAVVPNPVMLQLRALYLRHRSANDLRFGQLRRILTAFNHAGLDVLVLKGAALARLVYPDAGLRPMCDVDLLLRSSAMPRAHDIMLELGFTVPAALAAHVSAEHRHVPPYTIEDSGMCVSIELHTRITDDPSEVVSHGFDRLHQRAMPFDLGDGMEAYTLCPGDMLWHVYTHAFAFPSLTDRSRLIHVVDIIKLVGRCGRDIDWPKYRVRQPHVAAALCALHWLVPLPQGVSSALGLDSARAPRGVGQFFDGSPTRRWREQRAAGKSVGRILRDTVFPSEWWLQLYYGSCTPVGCLYLRWIRHPVHILYWFWRCLRDIVATRRARL